MRMIYFHLDIFIQLSARLPRRCSTSWIWSQIMVIIIGNRVETKLKQPTESHTRGYNIHTTILNSIVRVKHTYISSGFPFRFVSSSAINYQERCRRRRRRCQTGLLLHSRSRQKYQLVYWLWRSTQSASYRNRKERRKKAKHFTGIYIFIIQ